MVTFVFSIFSDSLFGMFSFVTCNPGGSCSFASIIPSAQRLEAKDELRSFMKFLSFSFKFYYYYYYYFYRLFYEDNDECLDVEDDNEDKEVADKLEWIPVFY